MDATSSGEPTDAELEARWALVRARWGARLDADELADLRKSVQAILEAVRALRAVPLGDTDEPFPPFVPFRADD
jgi:hypothetical protein